MCCYLFRRRDRALFPPFSVWALVWLRLDRAAYEFNEMLSSLIPHLPRYINLTRHFICLTIDSIVSCSLSLVPLLCRCRWWRWTRGFDDTWWLMVFWLGRTFGAAIKLLKTPEDHSAINPRGLNSFQLRRAGNLFSVLIVDCEISLSSPFSTLLMKELREILRHFLFAFSESTSSRINFGASRSFDVEAT